MGKTGSAPTYNPPAPPTLQTADQLYSSASNYGKQNFPNAFGAREGALNDLSQGNSYYQQFQPTSFEQALGNQYFQNVWPDQENYIKQMMSRSGLENSPALATTLGNARGNLGVNIGQFLSNQGNQRAQMSLEDRMGIDPMGQIINPYVQTGQNQSNNQANLNYGYAQNVAQSNYQSQIDQFNQQQSLYKTLGMISPLGGAIYGGANGGSTGFGSSLSGTTDAFSAMLPFLQGMMGGGGASSVNPSSASNSVNPYMSIIGSQR